MSEHAHGAVEDDHPGYSALANVSFVVSIPTLYVGGATAVGLWDADKDALLIFAVIAALCIAGGALGIAWSTLAGKRMGTGVAAIVVGAVAFTLTAWAY